MNDLTAERLREVLHYDPATGAFTNRTHRSSRARAGKPAGSLDGHGYVQIRLAGKNHKAHRLAFLYMTGKWPDALVDHRNGVRHDNRWANLRHADGSTNSQNQRGSRSDSGTELLGVSFDAQRGKYLAQISANGRKRNLGRFDDPQVAHQTYLLAKRQLHQGCTL